MLQVTNLQAGYGSLKVLRDICLTVPQGKAVALLGGNGAGKTTTMKAISGILPVAGGRIEFNGADISREASHRIFRRGLALVPQGRELFPEMSITENLELGALSTGARGSEVEARIGEVFRHFPRLKERARQRAGTLSGGEQQMLATGRALMSRPSMLLMDEPTTGLAPIIVKELMNIVNDLRQTGQTILLVEQNVRVALAVSDYVYVIRNGEIVMDAPAKELSDGDEVFKAYLG